MIEYGSDYLLGLATFTPEKFSERDRLWETGDARYYKLSDALQYLGNVAFANLFPLTNIRPLPFFISLAEFLRIFPIRRVQRGLHGKRKSCEIAFNAYNCRKHLDGKGSGKNASLPYPSASRRSPNGTIKTCTLQ